MKDRKSGFYWVCLSETAFIGGRWLRENNTNAFIVWWSIIAQAWYMVGQDEPFPDSFLEVLSKKPLQYELAAFL